MTESHDCIFCKIVARTAPSHVIWEDEKHLAFLSIFPNTEGFSVVIPKAHYSSYLFDQPAEVISDLVLASGQVAKLLDSRLTDVGRTGMIFESFGVDHLHAKLFPMHGTKASEWTQHKSNVSKYFDHYEATYLRTILSVRMTMCWRIWLASFALIQRHSTLSRYSIPIGMLVQIARLPFQNRSRCT